MITIVLALHGPDKAGLLKLLAGAIKAHHGNWLASKVSHLHGHFNALIHATIEAEQLPALQQQLAGINGLHCHVYRPESSYDHPQRQRWQVEADDNPSLITDLSGAISDFSGNISQLDSHHINIPETGATALNATVELSGGNNLEPQLVEQALAQLGHHVVIHRL